MKSETKLFIGIIVTTVIIVVGALFLFGKTAPPVTNEKVDEKLLIRSDSYKTSSAPMAVTLVEFGDYQCPACGTYHPIVKQLLSEFSDKMTFVFRNFPLTRIHENAYFAAQAAEAAGKEAKFWEMYDLIYDKQAEWSKANNARDKFIQYAKSFNISAEKFEKELDSPDIKKKIDQDVADANILLVNSTPTFYLNGQKIGNPSSLEDFRTLIKAAILKAPSPSISPSEYHTHFNLKIIVKGKPYDLISPKYQSTGEKELNPDIHVHDGNGDVVHIHKAGVTIGDFLTSLGMSLTADCFSDDLKQKFCNQGESKIKFYVNGQLNSELSAYQPKDLDRILISYGNESDVVIKEQLKSIADTACIYSEKCPERGKPPTEKCVGGLGTGCKD